MIKVGLIGAGKMGISHLSILGAHKDVEIVGVIDTSKIVTDVLEKYTDIHCYGDIEKMIEHEKPDAMFVATPTKYHASIVKNLLNKGIHVFVEKPFCLGVKDGLEIANLAIKNKLINQVGYHNKFIGTFEEAKELIKNNSLGTINHFSAQMNGPVVTKKKDVTWRSNPDEGGGCLMDYAAHIIDLINYMLTPITNIKGVLMKSVYSNSVEDEVFALVETENNISGVLNVNWSDETYRKMSTELTILGTLGKIIVDTTEIKVFFKNSNCPTNYSRGWNIKHINEFSHNVDFYLRGEEYSSQIDYFIDAVKGDGPNEKNTFMSAWKTDDVIEKIKKFKS